MDSNNWIPNQSTEPTMDSSDWRAQLMPDSRHRVVNKIMESEDLCMKAKSRINISLRSLSQLMSLGEIAKTWDICVCGAISEHAQLSGGGTFSSKYGTWDDLKDYTEKSYRLL